jgi:signal transduction histidine kinase
VIEWAKKQSEKANFNPEKIHLFGAINESLELLKPNAIQKEIKLENKTPKGIYVKADSLMLRSIIQNLVTNGIKYTPEGGSVIINAQLDAQMACVFVEDSGVGMTNEMQGKLFNKVNGASISGTNNEIGTGLGLLLVNDFVLQHGGTVNVESAVGTGTTFKFTIPSI